MAQWSRKERTLFTKLVYYGPAFGGKTTNLESLHRLTDPEGVNKLLSVCAGDDRTIFFDLLPFDLGDILGYQVAMKLYTVPGQVRYDTTRQVVLAGADAVIFVADSSTGREEQNRWSLQNLKMNMRARRLDPGKVPLVFQFNKQDLEEAAEPDTVAVWLGLPKGQGIPAVAPRGEGVLETFVAASRVMIERLVEQADERTRKEIDAAELRNQVERAFAPYRERVGSVTSAAYTGRQGVGAPIVPQVEDLLESSVEVSLELGSRLSGEIARAARLEREAEAYRRLSESLRGVGASFEREAIVDAALSTAAEILDAPAVSLLRREENGSLVGDRVLGRDDDPLLLFPAGRKLAERMFGPGRPCTVDDLQAECEAGTAASALEGLRAAVAVPVAATPACVLVAYAAQPDGMFRGEDVRFLDTIAGHLAVGLEKSALHSELEGNREQLEGTVASRSDELRRAYEGLRRLEQTKDRFLGNLSHEMKTPLAAILSSAVCLRDYDVETQERVEMIGSIVRSAEALHELLEELFCLAGLETEPEPLALASVPSSRLVMDASRRCGQGTLEVDVGKAPPTLRVDPARLGRALDQLVDNARKFSPEGSPVALRVRKKTRKFDGEAVEAAVISVLDRGPGVAPEDRERIFSPFEQGGDPLTGKPSGIGIGLHEARVIVRQHGGVLEYRPRKGGGSEFRVTIPVAPRKEKVRA
jgi:signal transduction histidine kinase